MGWGYYPRYVTVAEKKAKAAKKLARLKKKNPDIRPVTVQGRTIARTWWGKSWNKNLERYADYSNRIGRGRSYVSNGMVLDLRIRAGKVEALVQGTASQPYAVTVNIQAISKSQWEKIKEACLGKLDSLPELLEGKFPRALAEIFTEKGAGLFPAPKEIKFSCSCPDRASMCKHVAAALYGIGARLDEDPMLFFKLRNADVNELISEAVADKTEKLLKKAGKKSKKVLEDADLGNMFGIDMDDSPELSEPERKKSRKRAEKKTAVSAKKAGVVKKNARKSARTPKKVEKPDKQKRKKAVSAVKRVPKKGKTPTPKKKKESKTAGGTAIDTVEALILKSRKGMDIPTLMEKTGFDERKIYNIVYRLVKKGKIIRPERGLYQKP
ncbi:MAG: SWIM zinc finger family protein [Desulfococcaceae bacterium]|jgi:uncharacterized Zn finger protein|nr:SWIM zinc finger family protein [Desulfococcaceae bacterium]